LQISIFLKNHKTLIIPNFFLKTYSQISKNYISEFYYSLPYIVRNEQQKSKKDAPPIQKDKKLGPLAAVVSGQDNGS